MKHLGIAWRIVLTAYCFIQFAVQVLWLGKIAIPSILKQSGAIAEKRRQALFQAHRHVSIYLKTLSRLGLVEFDFRGKPTVEPATIVANHPSLLDFIVLQLDFPNAVCLYKSQTRQNPVLTDFVQVAGYIEGMDGSRTASKRIIDECCRRLEEGHQVVFFPEGTRSKSNTNIRRFRFTGFHAAIRSNVAVQPVAIYCDPLFLGKNQPWHAFSKARNRMVIEYLEPVRLGDLPLEKQLVKGLSDHVRNVIKDRLGELDAEINSRINR
jgi:1-acyl-sn-glycerol-3-phosphate acyltransferase